MEVICLETRAFYELIEQVVDRLSGSEKEPDKWISADEAMSLLGIKSKTTLQEYRDKGQIRYTQPRKRIILYDRASITEFLERNARETF